MATFPSRRPLLKLVNSVGAPIEGPYPLAVSDYAPENLGIRLSGVEASEHEEGVRFVNYQWNEVGYTFGYRLGVTLHFTAVEATASPGYGLTLLHRIWRAAVETQFTYCAVQFAMYSTSAFYAMVPASGAGWAPTLSGGKQGLFDVSLSFRTRALVSVPGEWAVSQW